MIFHACASVQPNVTDTTLSIPTVTQPITTQLMGNARYNARNTRRPRAGAPA